MIQKVSFGMLPVAVPVCTTPRLPFLQLRHVKTRISPRSAVPMTPCNKIDLYFKENPIFWAEVQRLLESLGDKGMSSDETDSEASRSGYKVVRRVPLPWLCDEVPMLWKEVEAFHIARQAHRPRRSNKPIPRIFEAFHRSSTCHAVAGLPKNFYNSIWWTSLHDGQQLFMEPKGPTELPDRAQYVQLSFSGCAPY